MHQCCQEGPISPAQLTDMYEKLPKSFEMNEEIFNQDFSGILNDGYFDLQGMMNPEFSQDNGNIFRPE